MFTCRDHSSWPFLPLAERLQSTLSPQILGMWTNCLRERERERERELHRLLRGLNGRHTKAKVECQVLKVW